MLFLCSSVRMCKGLFVCPNSVINVSIVYWNIEINIFQNICFQVQSFIILSYVGLLIRIRDT